MAIPQVLLYMTRHGWITSNFSVVISKNFYNIPLSFPIIQWLDFNSQIGLHIISCDKVDWLLRPIYIIHRSIFQVADPLKVTTSCPVDRISTSLELSSGKSFT
uniref:Uncharacterized protein n=1 Tax=Opuntia streptacantha TaxID=393608 RepID=A0A7C9ABE5_OPUST